MSLIPENLSAAANALLAGFQATPVRARNGEPEFLQLLEDKEGSGDRSGLPTRGRPEGLQAAPGSIPAVNFRIEVTCETTQSGPRHLAAACELSAPRHHRRHPTPWRS